MSAQADVDVLVIGAGPVGLTLANELRRRAASVRIVEKAPAIREISKAMIWHVRTQEALDKVGILQRGLAEGAVMREVVMRAYGERIGSWTFTNIQSPHPHALIIGQNRTQHLLADLLRERGAEVEYATEAVALEPGDEHEPATITIVKADGLREIVRARYVAGCEGSNSLVRKTLGLTFEGERYSGEQFIQADCKIRWALPTGRSYLFLTEDGYMMVIELPGGLVRIFISLPDTNVSGQAVAASEQGAVEDMNAAPSLEDIHRELVRLGGFEAELSEATWLARYRTSHRSANAFGSGRCFVAGDAGHVHVPIGGQGMNTGIQDACNLGWKLAGVCSGRYRPELLATYDDERRPVAQALLEGTDRSYRGILHPSELQQRLVRMFGPFVLRSSIAQDFAAATLEELSIAYRHTSLNADFGGTGGPKPGERARVDATAVRLRDMKTLMLADVTREGEWVYLQFGGLRGEASRPSELPAELRGFVASLYVTVDASTRELPGFEVLIDAEEHVHRSYGVSSAAGYLLRPDGVVALRAPGDATGRVVSYFSERIVAIPQ